MAAFANMVRPLDAVSAAVAGAREAVPAIVERSGLSFATSKEMLRPGDHVYAWKLGWAYNHHGIVVRVKPCRSNCPHDTLDCCSIVHFQPPSGDSPARIEFVSLEGFKQGRDINKCHYGVSQAEFYMRRSGSCSTDKPTLWPLVVLRALSLVDSGCPDGGACRCDAQVEYDLFKKNSELLARWCLLGDVSGIRRFRSTETAFSLQTSPGRFVRLGIAVAVPAALAVGAAVATSAAAAPATGVAVVASSSQAATVAAGEAAAATATTASGSASAASGAMSSAMTGLTRVVSAEMLAAGSLAASTAMRELLRDIAHRPHQAVSVLTQVQQALPLQPIFAQPSNSEEESRRYHEEQQDALVAALAACLRDFAVIVAKPLHPLLDSPVGCGRLCEMLVDVLEAATLDDISDCTVLVQSFVDDLL